MTESLERDLAKLNLNENVDYYILSFSKVSPNHKKDWFTLLVNLKVMVKNHLRAGDVVELCSREDQVTVTGRVFPSNNSTSNTIVCFKEFSDFWGIKENSNVSLKKIDYITLSKAITISNTSITEKFRESFKEAVIFCPALPSSTSLIPNCLGSLGRTKISSFEKSVSPGFINISSETKIKFEPEKADGTINNLVLSENVEKIMEFIRNVTNSNLEIYSNFGIKPPRGLLLYGPPGTGKTSSVASVCTSLGISLIRVDGPELTSKFFGDSERKLRELFEEAENLSPSVLFIDEIDAICQKRSSSVESRLIGSLLTLLDGISSTGSSQVAIVASTNRPDSIDPALRRPGRFDQELEFTPPSPKSRLSLLDSCLSSINHSISSDALLRVSEASHGFVAADIEHLIKEAIVEMLQRSCTILSEDDLMKALAKTKPSTTRDILLDQKSWTRWDEVAGNLEAKQKLKESVELPLKEPQKFERLGIKPPKGILLFGPPGCSKTLLAKALASESGLNFFAVKGPELLSKWVGDSEKAVQNLFMKARLSSPSIIFFDEFDSIGSKRGSDSSTSVGNRVLSQLLCEMDGINSLNSITVIAATNRPDRIDPALLRPGRFDRHIYIPLPDTEARSQIFHIQSRSIHFHQNVDINALASITEGYSGAEIVHICQEAAYLALKQNHQSVHMENFHRVIDCLKPRISSAEISYFEKFLDKN